MAHVIVLAGLGFGDEGKGSMVDYYARTTNVGETPSALVVRYNGGAQAAHNVVTPNNKHHTFAQFGSATLAGCRTHLSRFMLVNPIAMNREAVHLQELGIRDPYARVTIEADALVTNVYQIAANRIRENLRGVERHGSCGMGIGETVSDSIDHPEMAIRIKDLTDSQELLRKLRFSYDLKRASFNFTDERNSLYWPSPPERLVELYLQFGDRLASRGGVVGPEHLQSAFKQDMTIIFEGAQGVLLDQDYGFHPHTTWSDTTFSNADTLLEGHPARRVGILRGYHTRHGMGPLPTQIRSSEVIQADDHNSYGEWQDAFRCGHFDMVLAKYALKVIGGVDELVITNLDKLVDRPNVCVGYKLADGSQIAELPVQKQPVDLDQQELLTNMLNGIQTAYGVIYESPKDLVRAVREELGEIAICSTGPTSLDKWPTRFYLEPPTVPLTVDVPASKTWN